MTTIFHCWVILAERNNIVLLFIFNLYTEHKQSRWYMYVRMFTCRCTHICSKIAFWGDFTPPSIVRDERDVTSATVLFIFCHFNFSSGILGNVSSPSRKATPKGNQQQPKKKIRFFSLLQRPARDTATCGHAVTPSHPSARQNWGKKRHFHAWGRRKKKKKSTHSPALLAEEPAGMFRSRQPLPCKQCTTQRFHIS